MLVRDIMTSPAVTIRVTDDVTQAARVLDRLNLTSLPVVDQDLRLLGIISEADVIGQLSVTDEPLTAHQRTPRVRDVMTHPVLTVAADADVSEVVDLMRGTMLKSLPVLLHDRVVGMVSRRDIVRAIARGRPEDALSPV
jgi:Mg/Co/Ni transporter MgtE